MSLENSGSDESDGDDDNPCARCYSGVHPEWVRITLDIYDSGLTKLYCNEVLFGHNKNLVHYIMRAVFIW